MKIGLFFGSFNPIHLGHIEIAKNKQISQFIDEVWFVITPESPFKQGQTTASYSHRKKMVDLALNDYSNFFASNVELHLPSPQYTINTMKYLQKKHCAHVFSIIMGADNFVDLVNMRWKNSDYILNNFTIFVYNRQTLNTSGSLSEHIKKAYKKFQPNIITLPGLMLDISSTLIRSVLSESTLDQSSSNHFSSSKVISCLDEQVLKYILRHKLYVE